MRAHLESRFDRSWSPAYAFARLQSGAEDISTGAEAPRPARDRIDGRSPGLRVTACPAFPGLLVPVAVGHRLAAYSCGGSCGIGTWVPHRIPSSLSLRQNRRLKRCLTWFLDRGKGQQLAFATQLLPFSGFLVLHPS